MINNGDFSTPAAGVIYTAPAPTPAQLNSGNNAIISWTRVVNASGAARTFNLYINVNGTARNFIPVDMQLPIGACLVDEIPPIQLPPGGVLTGSASGSGVYWTINVEL